MRSSGMGLNSDMNTPAEWLRLSSGPLTLYFDPTTVSLRRLRVGDVEVVQRIYGAVRDRLWGTVPSRITALDVETNDDEFKLYVDVLCREKEIDFSWRGTITGDANGVVRFRMEGTANSTFWRNRIGLCVLHPIPECTDRPCTVRTTEGSVTATRFPDLISPHQPFLRMQTIAHEVFPGTWAELQFDGDTFEMEDQRNWTDASFKTYSTPLALPYPVKMHTGTHIVQTVTLTLLAASSDSVLSGPRYAAPSLRPSMPSPSDTAPPTTLRLSGTPPLPLPLIGIGAVSHDVPLSSMEIACLKALSLSHLRLELLFSDKGWKLKLRRATEEAKALEVRLEIALFLTVQAAEELADLSAALEILKPPVLRWLVFQEGNMVTQAQHVRAVRSHLRHMTPDAEIGGGTDAYFAELNRTRPPVDSLDCVCYSISPQVHAFDTVSLVENLRGQSETVRSAQAFCPGLPIVVSPVTPKPRVRPEAAAGTENNCSDGELPASVDARQCSLFGAGWTLGSLKALCESGVHSVTYYETTGWRGVMETATGSPLPQSFPSLPGSVFPLYQVLADIGQFAGGFVLPLEVSAPQCIAAMALHFENRRAVLCANLTGNPQKCRLFVPDSINRVSCRQLDAASVERSLRMAVPGARLDSDRVVEAHGGMVEAALPAFAYARLSWEE